MCKQVYPHLLTRNFQPCSVILDFYCSLSTCTFCVTESTKEPGSRVRHSVLPLFKSRFATSFSRFAPRRSLLVAMFGAARTRFAQTSCRLFPIIARLLAVPPNAALPPLAGNYLCEEDSLTYPMHYSAYNGNIFKPAPSKSQRTAGQAEETGQNLFERCIYAMLLLREKRVVLSPMLERTAVCGK